jgi:hypothetical protein
MSRSILRARRAGRQRPHHTKFAGRCQIAAERRPPRSRPAAAALTWQDDDLPTGRLHAILGKSRFEHAPARSGSKKSPEEVMGPAILAVLISGLMTAACASPALTDQAGERVLIRNGFTVPAAKVLLVDDLSVDCVIASEVFDEPEFHKVGVEATAYLRIIYPNDACPEALDSEGECPTQDYAVGTGASRGVRALFIQPDSPDRHVLRVGAGREMNVFAGARATLVGICQGVAVSIINAFITAGSGHLVDAP